MAFTSINPNAICFIYTVALNLQYFVQLLNKGSHEIERKMFVAIACFGFIWKCKNYLQKLCRMCTAVYLNL